MASLTAMQPKITILDQDVNMVDGLYSLNDMHRIGGGEKRHQPYNFIRNKEVGELIDELHSEINHSSNVRSEKIIRKVNGGEHKGTYACKEIIYRYAMWVDPKFALIVIRVFEAVAKSLPDNQGYQLGSLQSMRDENRARYAVGFTVASGGGKEMNKWKYEKRALDTELQAIDNLIQPLLTGFEVKAVEVVK